MGQTFTLCVHSWDTILDIKTRIQDMEGTPAYLQRLLFDKYQDLDDSGTLADCNIKNGSVIRLIPSGKLITVKTLEGKTISFRTSRLITIRALKYQFQKEGGIRMDQYRLFKTRKHTEDENQTMEDYGISINEDWVIDLVRVVGGRH